MKHARVQYERWWKQKENETCVHIVETKGRNTRTKQVKNQRHVCVLCHVWISIDDTDERKLIQMTSDETKTNKNSRLFCCLFFSSSSSSSIHKIFNTQILVLKRLYAYACVAQKERKRERKKIYICINIRYYSRISSNHHSWLVEQFELTPWWSNVWDRNEDIHRHWVDLHRVDHARGKLNNAWWMSAREGRGSWSCATTKAPLLWLRRIQWVSWEIQLLWLLILFDFLILLLAIDCVRKAFVRRGIEKKYNPNSTHRL